jgi:hypothetical protein
MIILAVSNYCTMIKKAVILRPQILGLKKGKNKHFF